MATINGTEGDDTLFDNDDSDTISAGGGNDRITVRNGYDTVSAGAGVDTLVVDYSSETAAVTTLGLHVNGTADGGFNGNYYNGSNSRRVDFNSVEKFVVSTGGGNDNIRTGSGHDIVNLGAGDDFVDLGEGTYSADGGDGVDGVSANLSAFGEGVTVDLTASTTVSAAGTLSNFEYIGTLTTTAFDDVVVTRDVARDEIINTGAGADRITVRNGYDIVGAGADIDTLVVDYSSETAAVTTITLMVNGTADGGFNGNYYNGSNSRRVDFNSVDKFDVTTGSGNDNIRTGSGHDIVNLGAGDDIVDLGEGTYSGNGGDGVDGVSANLSAFGSGITIDLTTASTSSAAGTLSNFEYIGTLTTTAFDDVVVTRDIARGETINTGEGADRITVRNGYDLVSAGSGIDTLVVDYSSETAAVTTLGFAVNGTANGGFDGTYYNGSSSRRVDFNSADNFVVTTGSGNDNITTGSGDDIVNLGAGDDFVNLGSGNDSADGGDGVDGVSANLSAFGAGVTVDLTTASTPGGAGTLSNFEYIGTLTTTAFDDVVVTRDIARGETINTGAGADRITVRNGYDLVSAGSGIDTLVVDYSSETAAVTTLGFAVNGTANGGFDGTYYNGSSSRRVDFNSVENFVVTTGSGNDNIRTGSGHDIASLGAGDDIVDLGTGTYSADGGDGVDGVSANLSAFGSGIIIDLTATSTSSAAGTLSNFEYIGTLTTTAFDDVVVTRDIARDETINAGAGADRITVRNGYDIVNAGAGIDMLVIDYSSETAAVTTLGLTINGTADGGFNGNYYNGSNGRRVDFTSVDKFVITTGSGNDIITTGGGDDEIRTGAGNDTINAGAGDDLLDGGGGADSMTGGLGNDIYVIDDAGDQLFENAGEGTDTVRTSLAAYTLGTHFENLVGTAGTGQTLTGNNLDNAITGAAGADMLEGGAGNDLLDGGAGGDTMSGGTGNDVYIVDSADDRVIENGGEGDADEVRTSLSNYVLPANVERLVYTGTADGGTLRGNASNNVITGSNGRNVFLLQDGGDDSASGQDGIDSFYFGAAFTTADYVDGGSNRDSILLQGDYSGGVTFGIGTTTNIVGVESISLLSGSNASFGDTADNRYSYNLTLLDSNVAAGALMKVNRFHLLDGENFRFDGSAETESGYQVFGGLGTDTFIGGQQNDNFIFGHDGRFAAGDTVVGGAGYDVVYLRGDYTIDFNAAGFAGSLSGVESIALLTSANTEFLGGGDGEFDYSIVWNDAMLADGAAMTFNGSRLGANETFLFDGSQETDGKLKIWGGAAADTLTGGGGDDLIYGGAGADQLGGNGGADVFRYQSFTDSTSAATDTILDFTSGADRIDLSRIDAKASTPGEDDAFAFIGAAAFSAAGPGAAGELRAFNVSGNVWQVEGDMNGDGVADLVIQVYLGEDDTLTQGDFML
ncbi:MAG TPA: calcium-binding protein [Allosphingosinicella sp.]|nr:calcium-binding protein [Allosphingosinicella sp.]